MQPLLMPTQIPIIPRHPVVALAPASPSSYGSARSSTNRPSSAGDQSLSLHSLASSDVNINANPNTNINANANHPQQAKLRNSGVVLGVELLERRQLDWERKRAQEYSRWKSLSEKQIDASAAAIASATIKGNGNSQCKTTVIALNEPFRSEGYWCL